MKFRLIGALLFAVIFSVSANAQNKAENGNKERLKSTVTQMGNGDIIVDFSLDCPPKLREAVPNQHHYMYDLWLPYMVHFDKNVKWNEFNAVLKGNTWENRDAMFTFLKNSVKLNCKLSKNPSPRSLTQAIDKGMPLLIRIDKFNASHEALISRRSKMREKIRSKEQRQELLESFSFNVSKAQLYGGHHPKVFIGYNHETKEYCIKMNRNTNIWYTEAEMKKILREAHIVSIP